MVRYARFFVSLRMTAAVGALFIIDCVYRAFLCYAEDG